MTIEQMETFYRELEDKNMDALWRGRPPARPNRGMEAPYTPCHWAWTDIRSFMDRAARLLTPGRDAERRVVQLINPALVGLRSASHTLTANVQMVLPGEIAPSHRHTAGAIRFIIEGETAVTIVNGEPIEMKPGDLVLTPGCHWHGHTNDSDGPMLWMDTLDRPLVQALRQMHQEPYQSSLEALTQPMGASSAKYGAPHLRAVGTRQPSPISPLFRYPWSEAEEALHRLAKIEEDPYDDIAFDYINPATGGHVMPTIGCRIQMLRAGIRTKAHRHSSVSVYHVFRGTGATIIDGMLLSWKQGDFFVVPPYSWHEHQNDFGNDAVLFSTTDIPVLELLHLQQEEAYLEHGGYQPVTSNYAERSVMMHAG